MRDRTRAVFVILSLALLATTASAGKLALQRDAETSTPPAPAPAPGDGEPTLVIPGIEIDPVEAAGLAHAPTADTPLPPPVIAFLELAPLQVQQIFEQRVALASQVHPLIVNIVARETLLRELLEAGDNPAAIGVVILEIRQLYGGIVAAHVQYRVAVESVLDAEQRERLAALRVARELQPLLPAFAALGLL